MSFGTETEKKRIQVDALGKETVFYADESILAVCEEIKAEAKQRLSEMKNTENGAECDVLADVGEFLKESIRKLMGDGAVSECVNDGSLTVPEYTELLCSCISKIGDAFVTDFGKDC